MSKNSKIKNEIKAVVVPALFKIAMGVGLLLLVPSGAPLLIRIIAVLILAYVGYNFIQLVYNLPIIIEFLIPSKKQLESEKKQRLFTRVAWFFNVFFGVGLFFLAFEIRHIENTIHGMILFWEAAGLGVLVGVILLAILKIAVPNIYNSSEKNKGAIVLGCLLGFFMISPAIASKVNKLYAKEGNIYLLSVSDKGESTRKGSTTYWFFFSINNREERIDVKENLYNNVEVGDSLFLATKEGYLGYDIVSDIYPEE